MAKYTVTVVDTTGIQPYIFGSNRLQENIGASELVRLATGEWALEAVIEVAAQHNVKAAKTGELGDFEIGQATGGAAEVIYSGGGNTVVIFSGLSLAREFARRLTRQALRDAPGLSLVVAHDDQFDWDSGAALSVIVSGLIDKRLAARKASRLPSSPLLGLGVTAACESTGLVATRTNEGEFRPAEKYRLVRLKLSDEEQTRLISREVACKLWARDAATRTLKRLFARELSDWYEFPSDMDKLGRIKGEESYVAVVHADGNGMGRRVKQIADDHPNVSDNRKYIREMRKFSDDVEKAASEALRRIVKLLTDRITWEHGREHIAESVPMEGAYLPFRPLVFGGDDVTFVCNGQLGLSLSVEYLKAYEEQTKARGLKDMCASAGVAIVKMHYPFARAYALSVELAGSAKSYVWQKYGERRSASALDWHIAMSGLSGSISAIRAREYQGLSRKSDELASTLLMRPLLLRPEPNDQDGRAWCERLEKLTLEFQRKEPWAGSRNKLKSLREVLREGLYGNTQAVTAFLRNLELNELPEIVPGLDKYRKTGSDGNRCGYFDAIELLDHYLHLPFDNKEEAK